MARLDPDFLDNLGRYRKYRPDSLRDLLRVIRNKHNHFRELPDALQAKLGPLPDGFLRCQPLPMTAAGLIPLPSLSIMQSGHVMVAWRLGS